MLAEGNENVNTNMQRIYNLLQDNSKELKLINRKFDDINNRCSALEAENRELTENYNFIYDKCQVLEAGLSNLQQLQIENNIVIRGIPEIETNENELKSLIKIIALHLKATVDDKSITNAYRIGKKKDTANGKQLKRPIVVSFSEKKIKETIMLAKRKKKLSCDAILVNKRPMGTESEQIFIDEQLIPQKLKLFHEARQLKKQGIIQFAWTKNGRVLLKEKENERVREINHEGHLDVFFVKTGLSTQPSSTPTVAPPTINNRGRKRPNQTQLTEEVRRNLRPRMAIEAAEKMK